MVKKSLKILLIIFFFVGILGIYWGIMYGVFWAEGNVSYIDVYSSYEGSVWVAVNYGGSGTYGTYMKAYSDGNMSLWMNGEYVRWNLYRLEFQVQDNVNVTIDGNVTKFYFFVDEIGDGSEIIGQVEELYKKTIVERLILSARMEGVLGLCAAFVIAIGRRWIKFVR